jgi:hypothetical protein
VSGPSFLPDKPAKGISTSTRRRTRARLSGVILDVYSLDGTREADLVVVEAVELLGSWPQSSGRPLPSLPYACGLSGDSGFFPTNSTTPRPRTGRSR